MKKMMIPLATILWMALIFYLSHQPAVVSSELSRKITGYIVMIAENVFPNMDSSIGGLHNTVRDHAHFLLFFVLGLLVMSVLRVIGIRGFRGMVLAFLLCVLYAAFDEIHQRFAPGRGFQLKDLLTDSMGTVVGIVVYLVISKVIGKGRKKKI